MARMSRFITPGAALFCALALFLSGWALYSYLDSAKQRRRENARAWHAAVCYLESQVVAAKKVPDSKKAEAIRVYEHILTLVGAPPCGPAR